MTFDVDGEAIDHVRRSAWRLPRRSSVNPRRSPTSSSAEEDLRHVPRRPPRRRPSGALVPPSRGAGRLVDEELALSSSRHVSDPRLDRVRLDRDVDSGRRSPASPRTPIGGRTESPGRALTPDGPSAPTDDSDCRLPRMRKGCSRGFPCSRLIEVPLCHLRTSELKLSTSRWGPRGDDRSGRGRPRLYWGHPVELWHGHGSSSTRSARTCRSSSTSPTCPRCATCGRGLRPASAAGRGPRALRGHRQDLVLDWELHRTAPDGTDQLYKPASPGVMPSAGPSRPRPSPDAATGPSRPRGEPSVPGHAHLIRPIRTGRCPRAGPAPAASPRRPAADREQAGVPEEPGGPRLLQ